MKRFILHVGLHKTATSSIQETFACNQEALSKQGFYYPIFESDSNKRIINHSVPFYSVYCEQPELYPVNILNGDSTNIASVNENYLRQIDEVLQSDMNVIISGEDISSLDVDGLGAIKKKVISSGFSLEVFCSVRRPYSYTCSALQEQLKGGTLLLTDIEMVPSSYKVKKLKEFFDEDANFFNFEESCKGSGPVINFLHYLGIKDVEPLKIINSNEGFGNVSTRALAHLNQEFIIIKEGKLNPKRRNRFTRPVDGEKFLLTENEFSKISSALKDENNKLEKLLGVGFVDKEYKLSKQIHLDKETALKVYNEYAEPHTSISLLSFINDNSSFPLFEFSEFFNDNADVLRDIATVLEDRELILALKCMKKAEAIRPNGPTILKKIEQYEQRLRSVG